MTGPLRVTIDLRYRNLAGINVFARELLRALAAGAAADAGVRPIAVDDRRPDRWQPDPGAATAAAGAVDEVLLGSAPFRLAEQLRLPGLIRRAGAAVHHSPHFNVPYLARVPIVLTVHDLFPLHDRTLARSGAAASYYRMLLPAAVRRATRIAAVSRYTADDLTATLGVEPAKISVIPHGVDRRRWQPAAAEQVAAVRARFRLPDPYLLYVGTGKPTKNLATLLRAHGPELPPLVVAGADRAEVAEHADVDGCRGELRFLGRVPAADLPALYSGALTTVLPSLYEGAGFTVLESMGCGTPVVASTGGALPDTVAGAGVLVDPLDTSGWTDALRRVSDDAELRAALRDAGLRRVAELDWRDSAAAYCRLYREVAAP